MRYDRHGAVSILVTAEVIELEAIRTTNRPSFSKFEKCCKNSRSSARPVNPILDGKENVAARKTRGSICIWGLVQEHLTTSSRR